MKGLEEREGMRRNNVIVTNENKVNLSKHCVKSNNSCLLLDFLLNK